MAYNSFSLSVDGSHQANAMFTVEKGHLISVMLGPERIGTGNAEYYGQVFLVSTEAPHPVPISILSAGYFGASVYIGWTGKIKLEPTYAIHAYVWSPNTIPVRCTILTEVND